MATVPEPLLRSNHLYPSSDGKPVAETDWHFDNLKDLRDILRRFFADEPMVYVAGNMLMYYEPGDLRRHVSPDVFVVKGVPKGDRPNYLVWEEGKAPAVVIELTSASTRDEDIRDKFALYRDTLRVKEYFLFDPLEEYLNPSFRGYVRKRGEYSPIKEVDGRLPSGELGLHLYRDGVSLRLYDPETKATLPTADEAITRKDEALAAKDEALAAQAEEIRTMAAELARLRAQVGAPPPTPKKKRK